MKNEQELYHFASKLKLSRHGNSEKYHQRTVGRETRCTWTLHRCLPLSRSREGGRKWEIFSGRNAYTRVANNIGSLPIVRLSTLTFAYLFFEEGGGSCRPATTRISESLVFSACPANTPFPVNYNYRRRLNVLRPERRLIFQMSSGCEGCARNSGKWGVFSIPF